MGVGFGAGLRALITARTVMDVIGHNLANQNTPGYSRQIALLATTNPAIGPRLTQLGTGVEVVDIRSVVNESLLARIRTEAGLAGRFAAETSVFDQIESLLGDLTENGLSARLQDLFNKATEAATTPEDLTLRQNFLSSASELALGFRQRLEGFAQLRSTSILDAQTIVSEVNQLLTQVSELNGKIQTQLAVGTTPSDLKDLRSASLERLAELIGAQAQHLEDGTVNVSIAGATVVSGASVQTLNVSIDTEVGLRVTAGKSLELKNFDGRLGGLRSILAGDLNDRVDDLNELARNVILQVNRTHARGVPATGPFQNLSSTYGTSIPPGIDPLKVTLKDAGLPFEIKNGVLSIAVTHLETGDVTRHEITISPGSQTVGDLLDSLNAIPQLSAFIDGVGKLKLSSTSAYGFDFSQRLDQNPVEGGTFGAGNAALVGSTAFPVALAPGSQLTIAVDGGAPQTVTFNAVDFQNIATATAAEVAAAISAQVAGVTANVVDGKLVVASGTTGSASSLAVADGVGSPAAALGLPASATGTDVPVAVTVTGSSNLESSQAYTFKPSGDGEIGVTPGLTVDVFDENGAFLTSLPVGEGYEPGTPLEFLEGVFVAFEPGEVEGSAGQYFDLTVPGDTDTSDILAAFGLNALFQGTDASSIDVSALLEGHPELVAGAAHGGPGDGGNFLALAAVGDLALDDFDGASINGFYNAFAAEVGSAAAGAESSLDATGLVLLTLQTQRYAESGVNPDEELLLLERFQSAYEAAARFLSVLNSLDDVLLQI